MRAEWPLVGRERDLAAIAAARAGAVAGGFLLAGPSGVGKTCLAREAAAAAEGEAVPVRWVRGSRTASRIPLAAFAPLLPTDLASGGMQLRAAVEALRAEAGDAPLVLVVDDVQFLDESSAALLLQLVVLGAAFVVATLRTGTDAPDAVTALWKDELVARHDVAPLSPSDVETLLGLVLGEVESSTSVALARASGGNPLYLRELVIAAQDAGRLRPVGGLWRVQGRLPTSPRLQELVSARLAGLSPAARRVLEVVAVGEPVGLAPLEQIGGGEGIDELERAGVVDVLRNRRRRDVTTAHAVYGEVVRESITTRRFRDICRDLAAPVEAAGARRRDDKRRIAMWRLESGDAADAGELLAAARDSRVARDFESTERFARAALASEGNAAAGHLLGEVLDELGRHDEAESILAAAADVATTDLERALIAIARSDNLFRGLGRPEEAERVALDARATVRDEALVGEIDAQRAINRLFAGRVHDVLELTDPMIMSSDRRVYSQAALQASMAGFLAGRFEHAVFVATRGFEARVGLGDQIQLADAGVHLVALALAQAERGDIDHAVATARAGYDGAAENNAASGQAYFALALARAHLLRGEVVTAARYAREAAVLFGEFNHPGTRWGYGALALAVAQLGDPAQAEEAISDLDAEPETPVAMMDADIDRARGWVAAARGELPRARALLLAAAERAAAAGQHGIELAALFDVARLGEPATVVARLEALAPDVEGPLAELRIRLARAHADRDAEGLDALAAELEATGARLWAAEAANEAAIAYRARGDTRRAGTAAERATALAAACEGARTPGLQHGTETAVLTRREREIATLASQGLSSREIGGALGVSPRTVENHLQRAYEKLGVRGRTELVEALARASL